jgi:hypothetical protein
MDSIYTSGESELSKMLKDIAQKLQSPRVDDGHGGIPYWR